MGAFIGGCLLVLMLIRLKERKKIKKKREKKKFAAYIQEMIK